MRPVRIVVALSSLIVLPFVPGPLAAAEAMRAPDLTTVVQAKILDSAARRIAVADTEVNVMRETPTWAFGAAIATAPHAEDAYPEGWLFVANRKGREWTVAFEGEAAFPALTSAAPADVVSAREKDVFASHGPAKAAKQEPVTAKPLAGGDYRTGMRLPWALGQSWRLTGGPHGAARQSIDLAGGDGRVLAARGGTLYVMCSSQRGWVRVAHDRGYSTDYYHLHNNRTDNGATVAEGAFLGNIGVDVSCGGSATGAHVHFSLRQNAAYVGIAAHNFGKWQVYNGAAEYEGYALHGSTRANLGGSMYNYGKLGFTQGIVDTNGGGVLNRRTGPGTNHAIAGTVDDGATVSISCSANGTTHTGRFGYTTAMWNKLTDGTWISDAFTWTGTANPVNGWC